MAVHVQIFLPPKQRPGIGDIFLAVAEAARMRQGADGAFQRFRIFLGPARAHGKGFFRRRFPDIGGVGDVGACAFAHRDIAPGGAGAEAGDLARLQRLDRARRRHHRQFHLASGLEPRDQLFDRLRLITLRREFGN